MKALKSLCDENHIISALAIDQRGALKKMMGKFQAQEVTDQQVKDFKEIITSELTPYASAILLDPEYGLPATKVKDPHAGELLAYEHTGYDPEIPGRMPRLLTTLFVKRIKKEGADACKFLLYYDVDEADEINEQKHAFIERIGSECLAEDLPFFLEIITYDAFDTDSKSKAFALKKPHKFNGAMKEFSKDRYKVDVLKGEVPVNMAYMEGYAEKELRIHKTKPVNIFKNKAIPVVCLLFS